MAVIEGGVSAELAGVGSQVFTPHHVAAGPMPVGAGGAYRISQTSGTVAASLGANSEIYQFRYVTGASRVALIHGVSMSAAMVVLPAVAATTFGYGFFLTVARSWSGDGTGGTAATLTGNNQKKRTAHATTEVVSSRIATTAALGAGTKTLDAQNAGGLNKSILFNLAASALDTTLLDLTDMLGRYDGLDYPLTLANQEGFVIRSGVALPATMTWNFTVNVAWSEVNTF